MAAARPEAARGSARARQLIEDDQQENRTHFARHNPALRKAAAAIHVSGELSLLERKLVNVLLLNAIDKISTQNVWQPDEYRLCADWLPLLEWPSLVGLGSVYLYLRAEPGHGPMLAITRRCVPHACRDCGPGARGHTVTRRQRSEFQPCAAMLRALQYLRHSRLTPARFLTAAGGRVLPRPPPFSFLARHFSRRTARAFFPSRANFPRSASHHDQGVTARAFARAVAPGLSRTGTRRASAGESGDPVHSAGAIRYGLNSAQFFTCIFHFVGDRCARIGLTAL